MIPNMQFKSLFIVLPDAQDHIRIFVLLFHLHEYNLALYDGGRSQHFSLIQGRNNPMQKCIVEKMESFFETKSILR